MMDLEILALWVIWLILAVIGVWYWRRLIRVHRGLTIILMEIDEIKRRLGMR